MNLDVLSLSIILSAFDCVCSCTDPEWGGGVYGQPPENHKLEVSVRII